MPRRMEYRHDVAGVGPAAAQVSAGAWQANPIEVAECATCGHPYLFHFDARRLRFDISGAPSVGCVGCGDGHRCARDTTSIVVVYYPRHDDAD